MALTLTSSAFQNHGAIPSRFTCDGDDTPPALAWTGVPEGTKSLALILEDPDAPHRTFVHWVVVDLPLHIPSIPEGGVLPPGARVGMNDFQREDYGGPCPPSGSHRYVFKLYALDKTLHELKRLTRAEVEHAMKGHVLAHAELTGTYQRQG